MSAPRVTRYDRCVQDPARTNPTRIDADRAAGRVALTWADGHGSAYDSVALRWLCPCAYCRGEAGQPGWLDSSPALTADQTRLVDLAIVGSYALQPTWGDGHHTGYYTYALLRDRCPCQDCTRNRARRDADHSHPDRATDAAPATTTHPAGGSR
jgi:DUF971 family protein